jgi:uncharacterized protein (DUF924 family)
MAYLVLVDQLPRHIHRGQPRAYATDDKAKVACDRLFQFMERGEVLHIDEALLASWPLFHSEDVQDAQKAVDWCAGLAKRTEGSTAIWLRLLTHVDGSLLHLATVSRFGRYPHRNPILGRANTPEEEAYLQKEPPSWGMDQWPGHVGGSAKYLRSRAGYMFRGLQYGVRERNFTLAAFYGALTVLQLVLSVAPAQKRQFLQTPSDAPVYEPKARDTSAA